MHFKLNVSYPKPCKDLQKLARALSAFYVMLGINTAYIAYC